MDQSDAQFSCKVNQKHIFREERGNLLNSIYETTEEASKRKKKSSKYDKTKEQAKKIEEQVMNLI